MTDESSESSDDGAETEGEQNQYGGSTQDIDAVEQTERREESTGDATDEDGESSDEEG